MASKVGSGMFTPWSRMHVVYDNIASCTFTVVVGPAAAPPPELPPRLATLADELPPLDPHAAALSARAVPTASIDRRLVRMVRVNMGQVCIAAAVRWSRMR